MTLTKPFWFDMPLTFRQLHWIQMFLESTLYTGTKWETEVPDGKLIFYKCGTVRYIKNDIQMAKHNHTTNAGRQLYMRDDLWASGHFDFLLKPGISPAYRKRIMAIKEEAIESSKMVNNHYPNARK